MYLVLTFLTCGLFGIYWLYRMNEDLKRLRGESATAEGGRLVLYTILSCGLYTVYWLYVNSDVLGQLREEQGLEPDGASKESYIISTILAVVVSVGIGGLVTAVAGALLLLVDNAMDEAELVEAFSQLAGSSLSSLFWGIVILLVMVALACRRKSGDSPRLLVVFSAIVFIMQCLPPFLSLGFMQKSLNGLIEQSTTRRGLD